MSPVDSNGSTNPYDKPIPTTFLTHPCVCLPCLILIGLNSASWAILGEYLTARYFLNSTSASH